MAETTFDEEIYPTTSGKFVKDNYSRNGFGIQNQKSASERLGDYIDKKSSFIKKAGRYTNHIGRSYDTENQNVLRQTGSSIYKTGTQGKNLASQVKSISTYGKTTTVSIAVASWTMFVWYYVLVPISITAFVLLGAVYGVSESFIASVTGSVTEEIQNLYMWAWGGLIIASLVIHCGAWLHYKFCRIKSIGGTGATVKETAFMLSLIMSIIPGVALLPTILLWETAVEVYPN